MNPPKLGRIPQSESKGCKTVKEYTDSYAVSYVRHFPLARLLVGINLEMNRNPYGETKKYYLQYLGQIMLQNAYVAELYHHQPASALSDLLGSFVKIAIALRSFRKMLFSLYEKNNHYFSCTNFTLYFCRR